MKDVSRIKQIRDERGISLQEAKRIEQLERLTKAIRLAKTVLDLKPVLLELLEGER